MNPFNTGEEQPARANTVFAGTSSETDEMKRQAAAQLIQNYYKQLTDGCGNSDCDNPACASSAAFSFRAVDRNQLAVQAIKLSQQRAPLCDSVPGLKYAKLPVQESQQSGASSSSLGSSPVDWAPHKARLKAGASGAGGHLSSSSSTTSATSAEESYFLDEDKVSELIKEGHSRGGSWNRLIRTIGQVFSNPDFLMNSFLAGHKPQASSQQCDPDKDIDDTEVDAMLVDRDHPLPASSSDETEVCSVDVDSLRRSYAQLLSIPGLPFQGALIQAVISLSRALQMDFKYHHIVERQPRLVNVFVIVMEYPLLHSPEYLESAFPAFCKALGLLAVKDQARLVRVWSAMGVGRLTGMLHTLQQLMTVRIVNQEGRWGRTLQLNDDEAISGACSVIKVLYYASLWAGVRDPPHLVQEEKEMNEADEHSIAMEGAMGLEPKEQFQPKKDPLAKELDICPLNVRKPLIPAEEFVNEPLNEHIDISTDYYAYYRSEPENKFSFMLHNFVLNTASKHTLMYFDNHIRMLQERRSSLLQTIMHGGQPMLYLRLRVRRDHVVDDALVNLEVMALENPSNLKKQLFVEFEGEQGLDEGGVSKEFFQLIIEELFNPDIGMFTFKEETGQFWLNPLSFETESQFTLIGIILGLAIYNSCILNVPLPLVIYRKLLGKKGVFLDLFDVDPTLANSLQHMLEHEGEDLEEVFMQTFRIGFRDIFGHNVHHDLKEGGQDIMVTQQNKQEFVELYADYILNKSIETQFRAFKKGFHMVTNESPLKYLFRPDEVEALVCGCKEYDFSALEQTTEYDAGFTADSPTIKHFWEVVHECSEDDKKRLLQFTTGSDRVPVGGLSKLKFIIARNGPDSDKLPTSHTCFNVLLLPDYGTKEKLKERLLKAVMYSKGFGML